MKTRTVDYQTISIYPENDAEEALFRFWASKEILNTGAIYGDGKVRCITIMFVEDKDENSN